MRILLCAVMLGAAAIPAAAQLPGPDRTILIAPTPTPTPQATLSGALMRLRAATSPDLLVRRILSFDSDGDGRVTAGELPERMQDVMRQGDKNEDGWLTEPEIRSSVDTRLTARPPANVLIRRNTDSGFDGVINDLKLPTSKREQALAIVKGRTAVRNLNQGAAGDVYARLRELLDDEEYDNFVAAARRLSFSTVVVGGVVGGVVR